MSPTRITPEQLLSFLPDRGSVWLHACSGDSALIRDGLSRPLAAGQDLTITGIFVPGLNRLDHVLAAGGRIRSYFMLPEFAGHEDRVEFLPFSYRDIRLDLRANRPDAALIMVAPPDEDGLCSLGPVQDFLADMWTEIPLIIAHINPAVPRVAGTSIPFARFAAVLEGEQPLCGMKTQSDETALTIAGHAAVRIPQGATLQSGLGKIPEAVLRGLTGHRGLAVHSGLIGDSTLDLLEAGALRPDAPITAGVAIGSQRLYDSLRRPEFRFAGPDLTHDIATLANIDCLVTVNSALEVDLAGQAYAEQAGSRLVSGPGGASDFAAGARGLRSLRILALPATAAGGRVSRIIRPGSASGPVSLGRFETDLVVTEYGVADLRAASTQQRAARLAAIAAPQFRAGLADPA